MDCDRPVVGGSEWRDAGQSQCHDTTGGSNSEKEDDVVPINPQSSCKIYLLDVMVLLKIRRAQYQT